MVGELEVVVADQKAKILFQKDNILFQCVSFRSAYAIASVADALAEQVAKILHFCEIALQVKIGNRKPISLFPEQSLVVRWLSPMVRRMQQAIIK